MEIAKLSKLLRKSRTEDIVGEIKKTEIRDTGDFRRNGTGKLVGSDGEVDNKRKLGDIRREDAGEVEARKVERNHVTKRVARDSSPRAVAGGDVP